MTSDLTLERATSDAVNLIGSRVEHLGTPGLIGRIRSVEPQMFASDPVHVALKVEWESYALSVSLCGLDSVRLSPAHKVVAGVMVPAGSLLEQLEYAAQTRRVNSAFVAAYHALEDRAAELGVKLES